jgi:hypothetical protein
MLDIFIKQNLKQQFFVDINYKYKTRTCQQIKISDINYQDFKKLEPCKCMHP